MSESVMPDLETGSQERGGMNPESMEAGRELDALIAEKVMGLVPCTDPLGMCGGAHTKPVQCWGVGGGGSELLRYSTDISRAWEIIKKVYESHSNWTVSIYVTHDEFFQTECIIETDDYNDEHGRGSRWVGRAAGAPLAICRVALKAVAAP